MLDDLLQDARRRMAKSVEATKHEFASIRTGRASAALLDRVHVDYYGTRTPLNQLATVGVPEARMLTVTPYDKTSLKDVERAIMESDLGITPSNDGAMIRLPIPALTEDRRKDLVKVAHRIAEEGRIAVRNVRRDVLHHTKELEKNGDAGADDVHRADAAVQKLTDEHVHLIDAALKHKEEEIMEV
jgi:ribosome recycling factor